MCFQKIKAKARLFRKAGPAFRGFGPSQHYDEYEFISLPSIFGTPLDSCG